RVHPAPESREPEGQCRLGVGRGGAACRTGRSLYAIKEDMNRLVIALLLSLCMLHVALAQIAAAPHCAVDHAPPDAGILATPGGFLLVQPRNAQLSHSYTGCKVLWVADAPGRFIRLTTLYFENGRLRIAQPDEKGVASRGTCKLPGQSPGCEGLESNPLAALKLATWPR